jgi:hypothetical protein
MSSPGLRYHLKPRNDQGAVDTMTGMTGDTAMCEVYEVPYQFLRTGRTLPHADFLTGVTT